jgi:hypothetical protein
MLLLLDGWPPPSLLVVQIELFGDIAGISFTPLSDSLYIGIADNTYASLARYDVAH